MRVSGRMICNTERVLRPGMIAASTMVNTYMEKNKVLAPILGLIIQSTQESGMTTKFVEK